MSLSKNKIEQSNIGFSVTFNTDKTVLKSVVITPPDEYTVPDGIEEIGEKAFYNCKNFKKINLPDGLKVIRKKAFEGCANLETLIIPETVTKIEPRAFLGCRNIKEITLPH